MTLEDDELKDLVNSAPVAGTQTSANDLEKARLERLKEKIPGLELTYGDAEDLSLSDADVKSIQEAKSLYEVPLHLIRTYRTAYLVKECARIEWRNKMMEWQTAFAAAREQMASENKDPTSIEQILNMLLQERVVSFLLVHPKMEPMQLRRLPPGEIDTIFNGIMMALGFNQPVVPIKI